MSRITLAYDTRRPLLVAAVICGVLFLSWYFGRNPSLLFFAAPIVLLAGAALLRHVRLGLFAMIVVALLLPVQIGTGSEVGLRPVALLVPAITAVWLSGALVRRRFTFPRSPVHLPLVLFLGAGLLSMAIGNLIWDPFVPRKDNFILVQTAQWAIFAFSALAFWFTAVLADEERWLKWMTAGYLVLGGFLGVMRIVPPLYPVFTAISSGAVDRAPFWLLLVALAGGQLLFNPKLRRSLQIGMTSLLAVAVYFSFFLERKLAAYWVGIAVALCTLVWLRFPRIRVPIVLIFAALLTSGVVSNAIWDFAGGADEWNESGASRLTLIQRVVEVTMRNPITGLGPAAYRAYANMKPLRYGRAYWVQPLINSHNNYVDLFAHTGVVGLVLFLWFMIDLALLAGRLHRRYPRGFIAGYVNSMLAVIVGVLVIMALLDWFLPSVYNVGFLGFQSSVLVWLYLGGLVAIEQWSSPRSISSHI